MPTISFFYYCFNILNLKCELNSFLKAAKMIWTIRSFVMVDVLLLTLPLVLNQRKTGKKNLSCSYFTSQFITINFQITFLVIKYTVSLISCGLWKYYSCCFLFFKSTEMWFQDISNIIFKLVIFLKNQSTASFPLLLSIMFILATTVLSYQLLHTVQISSLHSM